MEKLTVSPVVKALEGVVEPIVHHSRPHLREAAERLKQSGGEEWAIGEMVERACIMLDALQIPYAGQEGEARGQIDSDVQGHDSGPATQQASDGGDGAGDEDNAGH